MIMALRVGETAHVLRRQADWIFVEANGKQGWVSSRVVVISASDALPLSSRKSLADGFVAGSIAAEQVPTNTAFTGGVVGGALLGLIGTGIAYFATGPSTIPSFQIVESQKFGQEYLIGFQQGFTDKSRARKRNAALGGGLLGTVTTAVIILATLSN